MRENEVLMPEKGKNGSREIKRQKRQERDWLQCRACKPFATWSKRGEIKFFVVARALKLLLWNFAFLQNSYNESGEFGTYLKDCSDGIFDKMCSEQDLHEAFGKVKCNYTILEMFCHLCKSFNLWHQLREFLLPFVTSDNYWRNEDL